MPVLTRLSPLVCLLLSACMVGPHYKEPIKPVVDHWLDNKGAVRESPFRDFIWWQRFHDPVLSKLIYTGYRHSLTLQMAGVRVLQARAQLAQATGELYPQQQQAFGNLTYYRMGGNQLERLLPSSFTTAQLGFMVNWELDFWGKYRHAIFSRQASFLASVAAYDSALVTLTADIATAYIRLRTTEAQIATTKANIQVQAVGVQIARARYTTGQTSLVDLEQAQTELAETQSRLPAFFAELQRHKDLLAILLGTTPKCINRYLRIKKGIPQAPKRIAIGIPTETMARRPDIYQARMEAIAQGETIGQIKANLYPAFSLKGNFAFTSNNIGNSSLGDIFQWSNLAITAGPGFTWNVLNYGQITNAVRAQDAVFQQALLKYINTVLQAQREVQDHITGFIESNKTVGLLQKANRAATETLRLTLVRYREGETDFTPVLNAEQQQLRIQTSLINAQGDVPNTLVALYRALGGGWRLRCGHDLIATQIKREMASRTDWGTLLQIKNHLPAENRRDKFKQLYLPKW